MSLTHALRTMFPDGELSMIEIGSHIGESTVMFAASGLFRSIIAVDPWKEEQAYKEFIRRTEKYEEIKPWRMTSAQACHKMDKNESFDLAYVDGLHDEKNCRFDINWTEGFLVDGGIMAGHDYNQKKWFGEEVYKVVNEIYGPGNVISFPDNSWMVLKAKSTRMALRASLKDLPSQSSS